MEELGFETRERASRALALKQPGQNGSRVVRACEGGQPPHGFTGKKVQKASSFDSDELQCHGIRGSPLPLLLGRMSLLLMF